MCSTVVFPGPTTVALLSLRPHLRSFCQSCFAFRHIHSGPVYRNCLPPVLFSRQQPLWFCPDAVLSELCTQCSDGCSFRGEPGVLPALLSSLISYLPLALLQPYWAWIFHMAHAFTSLKPLLTPGSSHSSVYHHSIPCHMKLHAYFLQSLHHLT